MSAGALDFTGLIGSFHGRNALEFALLHSDLRLTDNGNVFRYSSQPS